MGLRKVCTLLLAAGLLWFGKADAITCLGAGSVWGMKNGVCIATPYSGDASGVASLDASLIPTGLGQLGPGTEGLSLPSYRAGTCYLWARYDAYRVVGTPFESWPQGILRFRVDSLGVSIGGPLHLYGDTLTLQKDIFFPNNGVLRAKDTGGTYRRVFGMGATDFAHIWPSVSGGIGLDIRRFDDSDYMMRFTDPRTILAKDIAADTLRATGKLQMPTYAFANLPAHSSGSIAICPDCQKTTPCTGGGTGSIAVRVGSTWDCNEATAVSGEANTASNVGSGNGVFKSKVAVDLQFKSLIAGSGVAIQNNTNDLTFTASGDTTGLVYRPGRPNGQFVYGSSATSSGAGSLLQLSGYNDLSATGAATARATQLWDFKGSSMLFTERGQTVGLLINTGVGFVNGVVTGSWNINGNGVASGVDMAGWSGTAPGFTIRGKTSGSADQQQWLDPVSGVKVSWVDRLGVFHASSTPTTGVFDSIRVNLTSNLIGNLSAGTPGAAYTATFGQGAGGTDASTVRIRSGSSGTTQASLLLNRNGSDRAQFAWDGTSTFLDYTGTLFLRDFISAGNRAAILGDGKVRLGDGTTPTHGLEVATDATFADSIRTKTAKFNGTVYQFKGVDVPSAATLTLGDGNVFTVTGTTPITHITTSNTGSLRTIKIWCSACEIDDGDNIKLNGVFIGDGLDDLDSITLDCDDTNCVEAGRSAN